MDYFRFPNEKGEMESIISFEKSKEHGQEYDVLINIFKVWMWNMETKMFELTGLNEKFLRLTFDLPLFLGKYEDPSMILEDAIKKIKAHLIRENWKMLDARGNIKAVDHA